MKDHKTLGPEFWELARAKKGKETDNYCTPPNIIEFALDAMGIDRFDVDLATNEHSRVPCVQGYDGSAGNDGLLAKLQPGQTVWCNPPYSSPGAFVRQCLNHIGPFAMLLKLDSTKIWQEIWENSDLSRTLDVCLLSHRVRFWLNGAPAPSVANFPLAMVVRDAECLPGGLGPWVRRHA